jgi:hypothetical protein
MDNITISEIPPESEETQQPTVEPTEPVMSDIPQPTPQAQFEEKTIVLTDINVTDQNVAFNILISFITIAQKRGTFSINESAKIWECLKYFLTPEQLAGENSV